MSELHRRYEEEHVPPRMEIGGFVRATRYKTTNGGTSHLAVYELDDLGALERPVRRVLEDEPSPLTAHMLANVSDFTRLICEGLSDAGPRERPASDPRDLADLPWLGDASRWTYEPIATHVAATAGAP